MADGVYDRGKTADLGRQGLNGWLWGLITLDSMKYTIPAGASYTRTELVKTILSYQLSDDGFNLRVAQGSTADPDITAMAIQSMGPYYRTSTLNVKDPVDRALERLSQLQLDTARTAALPTPTSWMRVIPPPYPGRATAWPRIRRYWRWWPCGGRHRV